MVLAHEFHGQALGKSLPLVITGSWTNRVDIPPIGLWLRMNQRLAINLRCGSLKKPRAMRMRQFQQVPDADGIGEVRFERVLAIAFRARGTGQVIDLVERLIERLAGKRLGNVVIEQV